ncbi:MAG: helix-turn-helix transcriptional regulator [Thiomicrospira sp.]|nr:helix-turn-helix transcriptional regulator [Thiomicrospira sp.]
MGALNIKTNFIGHFTEDSCPWTIIYIFPIVARFDLEPKNMTLNKAFAETLKRLRQGSGLSQQDFAFEAGLDRTYISLLERGKRQPSLETLYRISKALNISLEDLAKEITTTLSC